MLILLRIVAGDEEATSQAAASAGRSRDVVREAAAFFLEQVLLHPDADSYRVLGATGGNLTANSGAIWPSFFGGCIRTLIAMASGSVFAARVTRAWNDLKTQERRAAYDRSQRLALAEKSSLHTQRPTQA